MQISSTGRFSYQDGQKDATVNLDVPITGSNGIEIVKNAAGDRAEVKLSNNGFTIGDTTGTGNNQTITLKPNDENGGACISVNYNGSMVYTQITPSGIVFVNPGGTTYAVTTGNLKTVFGQSVYGSGNIGLYRHNITIKINKQGAQKAWISTILISSSNTQIGNITDFFNTFDELGYAYPCMGFAPDNNGVNQSVINVEPRSSGGVSFANGPSFRWSDTSLNITVEDTVTTV